ncbi:MAG: hypothetical protein ACR2FO_00615, partial [Actinomycetota bacterium]
MSEKKGGSGPGKDETSNRIEALLQSALKAPPGGAKAAKSSGPPPAGKPPAQSKAASAALAGPPPGAGPKVPAESPPATKRQTSQLLEVLEARLRRLESSVLDVNDQVISRLGAFEENTKRALKESIRKSGETTLDTVNSHTDQLSRVLGEITAAMSRQQAAIETLVSQQSDQDEESNALAEKANSRIQQGIQQITQMTREVQQNLADSTSQSNQVVVETIESRMQGVETYLSGQAAEYMNLRAAIETAVEVAANQQADQRLVTSALLDEINNRIQHGLERISEMATGTQLNVAESTAQSNQGLLSALESKLSEIESSITGGSSESTNLSSAMEALSSQQADQRLMTSALLEELKNVIMHGFEQIAEMTKGAQRTFAESSMKSNHMLLEGIESRLMEVEISLNGETGVQAEIVKTHEVLSSLSQGASGANRALFDLVTSKLTAIEATTASIPAQTREVIETSSGAITERALQESQQIRQALQSSSASLGEQVLEISALWKAAQRTNRSLLELMDSKVAGIEASIRGSSQAVLEQADTYSEGIRQSLSTGFRALGERVSEQTGRIEDAVKASATNIIDSLGAETGIDKESVARALEFQKSIEQSLSTGFRDLGERVSEQTGRIEDAVNEKATSIIDSLGAEIGIGKESAAR